MSSPSGSGVVPDKPASEQWLSSSSVKALHEVTHDPRAGAFYIHCLPISPGPVRTVSLSDSVMVDHDATGRIVGYEVLGAPVPAVTDDEAATDWPLIAAFLTATHGIPEDSQDDDDRGWAIEAIAGLRSAGFLIVHHTKET